jgi:hypothetical protein
VVKTSKLMELSYDLRNFSPVKDTNQGLGLKLFAFPDLGQRESLLPMLLRNVNSIDIHALFEPSLLIGDLDIISAHHPFPHSPIFSKCPVFKTIRSPPLAGGIMPFIPELNGNLFQLIICARIGTGYLYLIIGESK